MMRLRCVAGLLAVLLLIASGTVQAQKVGTSSFQFLKVMPVARATALGDAYATLASGAEAIFWNPAGMASVEGHDLSTTLTLWIFDTRQSAISYAAGLGNFGTIGAQFQFVDYGKIEETRVDQLMFVGSGGDRRYNPGLTGNTFSPSAYVFGLSYARKFTERFSMGIGAKYVVESLYGQSAITVTNANGVAESFNTRAKVLLFDFGMAYNTGFRSIRLGISVQNLGRQVEFSQEGHPAPLMFRLGTAADLMGQDALLANDDQHRVTLAYDILQPNDYAQQMHAGMEYCYGGVFALRGGYKFNYDSDGLTLGAGIITSLIGPELHFDYSYGRMGEFLGTAHRLSLGVQIP